MNEEQLCRAADLAGLELGESAAAAVKKYIDEMLPFISPLAEFDSGEEPCAQAVPFESLRGDTVTEKDRGTVLRGKENSDGYYVAPLAVN